MSNTTVTKEEITRVKSLGFLLNKGTNNFSGRVITVNGKITAEQNKCISEAAKLFGNGIITFTTRLTVECQGIPYEKIEEFREYIKKEGLVTGGTGKKVRPVVACKGTTCHFGLIDTFGLSEKIHNKFFVGYSDVKLPHKFKIAVGGCPNNCIKPDLNDLGVVGQRKPIFNKELCKGCKSCKVESVCPVNAAKVENGLLNIDEKKCLSCGRCIGNCYFNSITEGVKGYKIYIGGRWGKETSHGIKLDKIFKTEDEVLDVVEKTILFFKKYGQETKRLSQTIDKIGFEKVQEILLSNELLETKEEILNI